MVEGEGSPPFGGGQGAILRALSSSRHSIIPYSLIITELKIVAPLAAAALFRRAALRLISRAM